MSSVIIRIRKVSLWLKVPASSRSGDLSLRASVNDLLHFSLSLSASNFERPYVSTWIVEFHRILLVQAWVSFRLRASVDSDARRHGDLRSTSYKVARFWISKCLSLFLSESYADNSNLWHGFGVSLHDSILHRETKIPRALPHAGSICRLSKCFLVFEATFSITWHHMTTTWNHMPNDGATRNEQVLLKWTNPSNTKCLKICQVPTDRRVCSVLLFLDSYVQHLLRVVTHDAIVLVIKASERVTEALIPVPQHIRQVATLDRNVK